MDMWIWLIAVAVFLVVEAMTAALTTIWFAFGSLAAFVVALLGGGLVLQLIFFFLVSAACLVLTKPLIKKMTEKKTIRTNADSLTGRRAVVSVEIDNLHAQGEIMVDGLPWTARSALERVIIPQGTTVEILEIKGVKCIVKPVEGDTIC